MTIKRFIPFIFLFSILMIFVTSCSKDDEDALVGEVEMTFPDGWTVSKNINELVLLIGTSPSEGPNDFFLENVNVVTENANGYSLESYYQANVSQLEGFKDYQFVSALDTSINGLDSKRIIFTATINNANLKLMDYFFHESNQGYVITCAASESSFSDYQTVFESIVSSFTIK